MRQTVGYVEDARTTERAKSTQGNKPRIPWSQGKKEAGLDRPPMPPTPPGTPANKINSSKSKAAFGNEGRFFVPANPTREVSRERRPILSSGTRRLTKQLACYACPLNERPMPKGLGR
jgi:hypothetical protein